MVWRRVRRPLKAGTKGSVSPVFRKSNDPGLEPNAETATFTPTFRFKEQEIEGRKLPPSCPEAAKIGTARITTPLLSHPLEGAAYLAVQNANPFGSLLAVYLVAQDPVSGTLVKLAGEVVLDPSTGQLVTTFDGLPQLPFEDLELNLFGGSRAPLATPAGCGSYTTAASFSPWRGGEAAETASTFTIAAGPGGRACPGSSPPFGPSFSSGMIDAAGGAFSTLSTTIGREDGQQDIQSVTLHMPPGLSGLLSSVKLCGEPQANAGTCGRESQIGETSVRVGVGSEPITVAGGRVFITGPYDGSGPCVVGSPGCAPFGLSIISPAKVGPFDLERDTSNPSQDPACDCVVVRAKIEVDPLTAAVTVITDSEGRHAIPHMLDGVPVHIRQINVVINRPGFMFNPTNCDPMQITGTIESDQQQDVPVTVPFRVANCAVLKFGPKFSFSTSAITSKADGASLTTKLTFPSARQGTQANLAKVKVELPLQLPSRLTTLQKACTAKQFDANPAACPATSVVGHEVLHTPLLPVPLEGPAYFVSNGSQAFPNLVMVLQGDGVTVDLVGDTYINAAGVTSSTFYADPDLPFASFELVLPEQSNSALAANTNLCALTKTVTAKARAMAARKSGDRAHQGTATRRAQKQVAATLVMPTEMIGQNGIVLHQRVPIVVMGCKPAMRILSHSVSNGKATITLEVPSAGRVVASAKGLSRAVAKAKKAGPLTLKLRLSRRERALLKRYRGRKLRARVKLVLTPEHGARLSTSVTVLIG